MHDRRDFLKTFGVAGAAALAGNSPRLWAADKEEKPKATADTMILLWMAGGMSHTETSVSYTHLTLPTNREV